VSGSKHRGRFCVGSITGKNVEIEYAIFCNLVQFRPEMVRIAYTNTSTMGTAFPRVSLEMTTGAVASPGRKTCGGQWTCMVSDEAAEPPVGSSSRAPDIRVSDYTR